MATAATVTLWYEELDRINIYNGFSFAAHALNADHFFIRINSSPEEEESLKAKLSNYEKVYCSLTYGQQFLAVRSIVDQRWLFGGPAITARNPPPVEDYYSGAMECLLDIPQSTTFTDYWTGHPDVPTGKPYGISCAIGGGCYWNRCLFCDYRQYNHKSTMRPGISTILSQLKHPESTDSVHTCTAACTPEMLREILHSGQAGPFKFWIFVRADRKLTKFVKDYEGSLHGICFAVGAESLSSKAMAILNKGFDFEAVLEFTQAALDRRAVVQWNLMDNLPFLDAGMADDYEANLMRGRALLPRGRLFILNNGAVMWPDTATAARFGPYQVCDGHHAFSIIQPGTQAYAANARVAKAIRTSRIPCFGEPLGEWLG